MCHRAACTHVIVPRQHELTDMSEQPSCRYVMGLTSDGEISSASADVAAMSTARGPRMTWVLLRPTIASAR